MKPDGAPVVEHERRAPHLGAMRTYQLNFINGLTGVVNGDSMPVGDGWTFYGAVGAGRPSSFLMALQHGLAAPLMLFSTPAAYPEFGAPTVAQCFGLVGSSLSEMIPVVVYDGRADAETEKAA